jgi:hypothetical protein
MAYNNLHCTTVHADLDSILGKNFRFVAPTVLGAIGVKAFPLTGNSSKTVRDGAWRFRYVIGKMKRYNSVKLRRVPVTVRE